MRYENPKPWPYRRRRKSYFFSLGKVHLKLEDKVLLGIGGVFFIFILFFINFMGKLLKDDQGERVIATVQKTQGKQQISEVDLEDSFDKSFREVRENFNRIHENFEENRKKSSEAFQKAQENFEQQFQEAQANFPKPGTPNKWFDEMVEQNQREFDQRFEEYPQRAGSPLRAK